VLLYLTENLFRGLELQKYSNEANWAQDGHVLMQPVSHFNYFVRGLLQICSYLVQQLPTRYRVLINPDIFLSAFTMEDEDGKRVQAKPWVGAPDGSAYDTTPDTGVETATDGPMDTSSTREQPDIKVQAHQGVGQAGIHTGQLNSIVVRRSFALKWIERQQKRYEFLPISVEKEPDWELLRNRIIHGPHGARQIKTAKAKKSSGTFKLSVKVSTTDTIFNAETNKNVASGTAGPKSSKLAIFSNTCHGY
jgi:hypothetical protein